MHVNRCVNLTVAVIIQDGCISSQLYTLINVILSTKYFKIKYSPNHITWGITKGTKFDQMRVNCPFVSPDYLHGKQNKQTKNFRNSLKTSEIFKSLEGGKYCWISGWQLGKQMEQTIMLLLFYPWRPSPTKNG